MVRIDERLSSMEKIATTDCWNISNVNTKLESLKQENDAYDVCNDKRHSMLNLRLDLVQTQGKNLESQGRVIDSKLDSMDGLTDKIYWRVDKVADRLQSVEGKVEDRLHTLEGKVEDRLHTLEDKMDHKFLKTSMQIEGVGLGITNLAENLEANRRWTHPPRITDL